jgi:DNA invertase Pin-like site-specific DNA recombinase
MAIIYARCSSKYQTINNYQSLDNQIILCSKYCIENNINIIDNITDIIPGHNFQLSQLYDVINTKNYINIIMADPSRLTRDVNQCDNILDKCKKNNILLHFVRYNLISNNLNDIKLIKLCIQNAYIETQVLSVRVKSIINLKKSYGSYFGKVPFGYQKYSYIDKTTKLKINKIKKDNYEQNIINIIKKLYYGFKYDNINKLFNKVIKKNIKKIKVNKLSIDKIIELLNNYNILNRNKKWTYNSVKYIIYKKF